MSNSNEIPWFNHLDLSYIRCSTLVFVVCHLVLVKHPVEYRADIAPSIADCQAEKGCPPLSPLRPPPRLACPTLLLLLHHSGNRANAQKPSGPSGRPFYSSRWSRLAAGEIRLTCLSNNSLSNLTWYVAFIERVEIKQKDHQSRAFACFDHWYLPPRLRNMAWSKPALSMAAPTPTSNREQEGVLLPPVLSRNLMYSSRMR